MNGKMFNLALMFLWLTIFVGLLSRDVWMSDELREKVDGPRIPLVIALTGLLTLWNFTRFFISYRFGGPTKASPEVEEYRRKIRALSGHDPKVTDPQFDFDAPPPDDRPRDDRTA
jgi:hypothetical protein